MNSHRGLSEETIKNYIKSGILVFYMELNICFVSKSLNYTICLKCRSCTGAQIILDQPAKIGLPGLEKQQTIITDKNESQHSEERLQPQIFFLISSSEQSEWNLKVRSSGATRTCLLKNSQQVIMPKTKEITLDSQEDDCEYKK